MLRFKKDKNNKYFTELLFGIRDNGNIRKPGIILSVIDLYENTLEFIKFLLWLLSTEFYNSF